MIVVFGIQQTVKYNDNNLEIISVVCLTVKTSTLWVNFYICDFKVIDRQKKYGS